MAVEPRWIQKWDQQLAAYVSSALPEQALLPQRGLDTLLTLVATLIFWGICALIYAAIRDHVV